MIYNYFCDKCKKVVGKSWKSVNEKESPADLSGTQYKRKLNANV